MATLRSADMETYPPTGLSEQGTVADVGQSAVWANSPTNSMLVDTTGGAALAYIAGTISAGHRMIVGRVKGRLDTAPGGTSSFIQMTVAGGNVYFRFTNPRVLQLVMNATNFNGPTIALSTPFLLEFRINTSANPWVVDWRVDGTARSQGTLAVAAADVTADNYGQITSQTVKLFLDDILITDTSSDYPLGDISVASPAGDGLGMMGFTG